MIDVNPSFDSSFPGNWLKSINIANNKHQIWNLGSWILWEINYLLFTSCVSLDLYKVSLFLRCHFHHIIFSRSFVQLLSQTIFSLLNLLTNVTVPCPVCPVCFLPLAQSGLKWSQFLASKSNFWPLSSEHVTTGQTRVAGARRSTERTKIWALTPTRHRAVDSEGSNLMFNV